MPEGKSKDRLQDLMRLRLRERMQREAEAQHLDRDDLDPTPGAVAPGPDPGPRPRKEDETHDAIPHAAPFHERRRNPRTRLDQEVQWAYGSLRQTGVVLDISEAGLSLKTPLSLKEGRVIKVFLPLTEPKDLGKTLFCVRGLVIWSRGKVAGVEFVEPEGSLCKALRRLVQSRRAPRT